MFQTAAGAGAERVTSLAYNPPAVLGIKSQPPALAEGPPEARPLLVPLHLPLACSPFGPYTPSSGSRRELCSGIPSAWNVLPRIFACASFLTSCLPREASAGRRPQAATLAPLYQAAHGKCPDISSVMCLLSFSSL